MGSQFLNKSGGKPLLLRLLDLAVRLFSGSLSSFLSSHIFRGKVTALDVGLSIVIEGDDDARAGLILGGKFDAFIQGLDPGL